MSIKKRKKFRNFTQKPAGKGKHKVHMGFDFASLTAEDKDAENGSELKGNRDNLMKEQAPRAIEYNVTTLCETSHSFCSIGTFLIVIHSGYCQKQDTGQDRYLVKLCISFVLFLNKYSWWILPS